MTNNELSHIVLPEDWNKSSPTINSLIEQTKNKIRIDKSQIANTKIDIKKEIWNTKLLIDKATLLAYQKSQEVFREKIDELYNDVWNLNHEAGKFVLSGDVLELIKQLKQELGV